MNPSDLSHPFTLIDRLAARAAPDIRAEIKASLLAKPASLAPKYFYDALGCALFNAITLLPEYTATRDEAAVFEKHRDAICNAVGTGMHLIDLGAADCAKGESWFPYLKPARYTAIDVARGGIEQALTRMAQAWPSIGMTGVVDDFATKLDINALMDSTPVLFFYPGSSLSNFTPDEAVHLLSQMRAHCAVPGSGVMLGLDMVKEESTMVHAYDDATGVTAAFNKNALNHVANLSGAVIEVDAFKHVALFDDTHSRIEMHLEATRATTISLDGSASRFEAGERIHTEHSYKYTRESIESLLNRAGFTLNHFWHNTPARFAVVAATAA
jgi:dimethylhistidine N-methyltransferase